MTTPPQAFPERRYRGAGFAGSEAGRYAEVTALGVLVAVSAWMRLYGLGELGLQVDEGAQALAVEGWLRTGLPILPSGLVYQRSIPFMALQTLGARVFGLDEFALRLPAALFGVGAVVATWALARALFDRRVAWAVAVFMALSAWEIELSRYGRFYTAFQMSFVLAFLCLFKWLTTDGESRWWWLSGLAAASMAAVMLHELSVALLPCFLIPLIDRRASAGARLRGVVSAAAFVALWIAYRRIGPWFASLAPPSGLESVYGPESATAAVRLAPFLPPIPLPDLSPLGAAARDITSGFHVMAALVLAVTVLLFRGGRTRSWAERTILIVALTAGVAHQFMLAVIALALWFAWFGTGWRDWWSGTTRPILVALGIALAFWFVTVQARTDGDWRALALLLLGFPNVISYFGYWFVIGWPFFLVGTLAFGSVMLVRSFEVPQRALLYVPAAIALPVVVTSLFASYQESRYVFHVYPLLVILFIWGLLQIADRLARGAMGARTSRAVVVACLAAGFLLSRDVGRLSAAPLTRTEGAARDRARSIISWRPYALFHQDQVGAARYLRDHAGPGDRIAAIGVSHQLAVYRFYLGRLDVAITRPENTNYQRRRDGRMVDYLTGAELVMTADELLRPPTTGSGWLIGDTVHLREDFTYFPEEFRRDARLVAEDSEFRGRDGVTFVVRLP